MKTTVLIEGIILIFLSLVGMTEGLRLIFYKDPHLIHDVMGPGFYVILLSIGLMAAGVIHLIINYRKGSIEKKEIISKGTRIKVMGLIAFFGLYLLLINVVGYVAATPIFFFTEFRIAGVKSWLTNILLTLTLSTIYYIIFIKYCAMAFPKGMLFN